MFVWNVWAYITGFAVIAIVQTQFTPGRARSVTLVFAVLVWVLLWTLLNDWRGESRFIVVELGLISSAALRAHGLWTFVTYLLLAAWYYESAIARSERGNFCDNETSTGAGRGCSVRLGALQGPLVRSVRYADKVGSLYPPRAVAPNCFSIR
jgi:hypothetical protein